MDTGQESSVQEILFPEAQRKLNEVITKAWNGIDTCRKTLPPKYSSCIQQVVITPNLREDLPDQIIVTIHFCLAFKTDLFKTTITESQNFEIACLSPNIEALVEAKFKKGVTVFIQQFALFLYAWADSFQDQET